MSTRFNFGAMSLFSRKLIVELKEEAIPLDTGLKRVLGPWQLTALGIGAIIGAGVFSGAGTAIAGGADHVGAGPALMLSYVLVAIACGFAALCYAEFAAMIPQAGSAYTYAYATLGELVAWIIGWDLIIEYAVGNIAVAVSWGGYFQELLRGFGVPLPEWLANDPITASHAAKQVSEAIASGVDPATLGNHVTQAAAALNNAPHLFGLPIVFNAPAIGIVALITWILVRGVRESAWANTMMVIVKLIILAFFLGVGVKYVRPENWRPFAPNGFAGVWTGASLIFFAYIGFDAVSTAAEESKNPKRDMPFAIIMSLVITSILYIAVTAVLTGLLPWNQLGTAEPLATAFSERGLNIAAGVISFGAIVATTSVLLVFQMGQPRIFYAMARDGLLPGWAATVHKKYRTPHVTTILTGVFVAVFAALAPIEEVIELTNIGTLFAFVLVAAGIIILRRIEPERPRPFRTPWVPLIPILAILSCFWLMAGLPMITWIRFGIWLLIGLAIYFLYGKKRSVLQAELRDAGEV
ncbi:MAG TPA: amino acid permease [Longimicrobiales bacterium]|nr:amino acid permease [Longimicrobiales bacterium]